MRWDVLNVEGHCVCKHFNCVQVGSSRRASRINAVNSGLSDWQTCVHKTNSHGDKCHGNRVTCGFVLSNSRPVIIYCHSCRKRAKQSCLNGIMIGRLLWFSGYFYSDFVTFPLLKSLYLFQCTLSRTQLHILKK